MPSSSDIQQTIDSMVSSRNAWNQELLSYNGKLAVAKKLSEKNSLKKAIKNAEDQIKDLDRQLNKLQNDLKKQNRLESDKPTALDNILSTAKEIVPKLVDKGSLESLAEKKSTGFQEQFNDADVQANVTSNKKTGTNFKFSVSENIKQKFLIYAIGAAVILIVLFKKK